jgi:hypothetical protein
MLNGTLTLGLGDTLVTTLTGAGTSGYAGINGTVVASNSALRYDVTTTASQTLASHSGFGTLGYQLSNGASLSSPPPAPSVRPWRWQAPEPSTAPPTSPPTPPRSSRPA